ncbi:TPA: MFS transporter [Candidatus Saccharibacteria bacterium]|nr:MFS transporter [Candidatus Saccharibacteria bacterium]HIO87929.1 MFS transporter [Candidatus Saccharibacteria bacterium]
MNSKLEQKMKRNLKLLYILRAIRSFGVFAPVIVLFFQENGLSQTEVFALQSIFAAAIVLLEVPSGYFADVFGRRISVVLGGLFTALGFGGYALASGFAQFLPMEILIGIGLSFLSGADQALARDSLIALSRESYYRKFESRAHELSSWSSALAALTGGFIALISLQSVIVAQAIVTALLVPFSLLIIEPPRTKPTGKNPWKQVKKIVRYSLREHQQLKWLIAYGAVVTTLTHTMFWLTQPLFEQVGVPLGWFGALTALLFVSQGLSAKVSIWYEQKLGKRRALKSFVLIGTVSYVLIGAFTLVWMLPVLLGFQFIRGAAMPVMSDYVHEHVESDIRATVMSVNSLASKLFYTFAGPVVGLVVDNYSLSAGLWFSALLYGTLGWFVLSRMNRNGDL